MGQGTDGKVHSHGTRFTNLRKFLVTCLLQVVFEGMVKEDMRGAPGEEIGLSQLNYTLVNCLGEVSICSFPEVSQKVALYFYLKCHVIFLATDLCLSLFFSEVRFLQLMEISSLLFCNLESCWWFICSVADTITNCVRWPHLLFSCYSPEEFICKCNCECFKFHKHAAHAFLS